MNLNINAYASCTIHNVVLSIMILGGIWLTGTAWPLWGILAYQTVEKDDKNE